MDGELDDRKRVGRYGPLFVGARVVLAAGCSVMLDGNFGDDARRKPLWALARAFDTSVIAIRTACDDLELIRERARWAKAPFSPVTLRPACTNDPRTWGSFDRGFAQYHAGRADGVGFVFSRDDPYAGVDLDGCRDPASGEIAPWASQILERLGSYAEVSPSGTGVKFIVRGSLPCTGTGRRRRVPGVAAVCGRTAEIEAYHDGRYFALTGVHVDGMPQAIERRHAKLRALWDRFFVAKPYLGGMHRSPEGLAAAPFLADRELLDLARRSRTGDRFRALYDAGILDAYDGDRSRADLALCGMLAFWTNGDPARIDRLFRRSALMRPRWDEQHATDGATYGEMTIRKTLSRLACM